MGIYERLGVRRVINADATLTRLGGSLMADDVMAAMRDAAGSFVDMYELQSVVGRRLAELTRNEAAYVSGGAAPRWRSGSGRAILAFQSLSTARTPSRSPRSCCGQGRGRCCWSASTPWRGGSRSPSPDAISAFGIEAGQDEAGVLPAQAE